MEYASYLLLGGIGRGEASVEGEALRKIRSTRNTRTDALEFGYLDCKPAC